MTKQLTNNKIAKQQRLKYPERYSARNQAKRNIPLKESCEICGSKDNLQRHHWNYNKPLMVSTLCITCHMIQHIKNFNESIYAGGITYSV
jgi:hypothetical protein